jgi:transposase InsO family protein
VIFLLTRQVLLGPDQQLAIGKVPARARLPRHRELAGFVREPEGNGCVERFIRTLKENLLWMRRFDAIEELRVALHRFQEIYNQTWIVERHGYQTPAAIRAAQLAPLPAAA